MKRSKAQPRWSMLAMLGLAVGSGYWALAGGCAPSSGGGGGGSGTAADEPGSGGTDQPDGQGGTDEPDEPDAMGDTENLTVSASSCVALDDQAGGFEIKVEGVSKGGKQLSYTRRFITTLGDTSMRIETEVMADGELVMKTVTSTAENGIESTIEYGPAVTDEESFSEFVFEDGMLTGTVAGRAIVPTSEADLDPENIEFEDGQPEQEMDVDPDLEAAVTDIFAAAVLAAEGCQVEIPAEDGGDQIAQQFTRQPQQDPGHDSSPETSGGCIACWGACSATAIGCGVGASAGCAAAFICWPCVVACEIAVIAGCTATYVGCLGLCEITGAPCCPVACGDVACCDGGETCLNSAIGICCSSGKQACVGKACCSATEFCIQTGPNAGTCCPAIDVCGNTCCDAGDLCVQGENFCCPPNTEFCDDHCCEVGEICLGNGVCCKPENACGDACCDDGQECPSDGLCCDPVRVCGSGCCAELSGPCILSTNSCCGFDQESCNGQCCAVGETCVDGDTCCADAKACGAICCAGASVCESGTCVGCPNPTDTPCNSGGCCPAGMNCTDNPAVCCPAGQTVCTPVSITCVPLSSCIN